MDASSLLPSLVHIEGSKSGVHNCRIVLADDGKTVVIYPEPKFSPSERVDVVIADGFRKKNGTLVTGLSFHFETRKEHTPEVLEGIRQSLWYSKQLEYGTPENTEEALTATVRQSCYQVTKPEILTNTSNAFDGYIFYYNFRTTNPYCFARTIINNNGDSIYFYPSNNSGVGFSIASNGYLIYRNDITSEWVMVDSSYQEIATYQMGNGYVSDEHDFDIFPNGRRLMMAYDVQTGVDLSMLAPGKDSMNVIGLIVQELDASNNVLFEWRSWDHLEFDDAMFWIQNGLMNIGNGGTYDYVHGNSVRYYQDTALLVSSRHTSDIMKISLNTGKIIWRLGGENNNWTILNDPDAFNAADGKVYYFSGQHDAHILPNGNLLFFNNDNNLLPTRSGAKEYILDESTKTATMVWRYVRPPFEGANLISNAMGNAQRLANGNTFINWGLIANVTKQFPKMTEVDAAGNIVWEFRWDVDTINYCTYRGRKYVWKRCNLIPPASLEVDSLDAYNAYLSWGSHSKISKYTLQYKPCTSATWITLGPFTANIFHLSGLSPNTCYEWRVQSYCSIYGEYSDWSPPQQFVTPTGVSLHELASIYDVQLIPNPATDYFTLSFQTVAPQPVRLTIYDVLGQKVEVIHWQAETGLNQQRFDVAHQPPSFYLLHMEAERSSYWNKLVVHDR